MCNKTMLKILIVMIKKKIESYRKHFIYFCNVNRIRYEEQNIINKSILLNIRNTTTHNGKCYNREFELISLKVNDIKSNKMTR